MRPSIRHQRSRDHGFTMVEVLVVLLIIAIISAASFMSVRGARNSGGRTEVVAAATRYSDAIDRFQQEHGRQVPKIGSPDWPVAANGPVHRLVIGSSAPVIRPYLKGGVAPEVMSKTGAAGATIAQSSGCPSPASQGGTLVYRTGPVGAGACGPALATPNQYSIGVYWNGTHVCDVGDVPNARRC